jgi:hypothetical protein
VSIAETASIYYITYSLRATYVANLIMYTCPCIVPVHAIKVFKGVEVQLHSFLIWAQGGSEWSASHLSRLLSGGELQRPLGGRQSRCGRFS